MEEIKEPLSQYVIQPHSSDILRFRLKKLMREATDAISVRTRMFDTHRVSEDLTDVMSYFPMFLATYLAIAWSIYIAGAIPDEDSKIYSSRYLDLHVDQHDFLSVLVGHVIERELLPEYRLGFLVALLKACHMTKHISDQKQLWYEFKSQLSSLFAYTSVYTEQGIEAFQKFMCIDKTNSNDVAE